MVTANKHRAEISDYLCDEYESLRKKLSSFGLPTNGLENTVGPMLYKKDGNKHPDPHIRYVIH